MVVLYISRTKREGEFCTLFSILNLLLHYLVYYCMVIKNYHLFFRPWGSNVLCSTALKDLTIR